MKLTKTQFEKVADALADAFPRDELLLLLRAKLGIDLSNIDTSGSMYSTIFQVIHYAETLGITDDLIRAVAKARPANKRVRAMLEELGVAADTSGLEMVVKNTLPFMDIQVWLTRLGELERRVCRVEVEDRDGSPVDYGTGFLVGPSTVMTSFHTVAQVIEKGLRSGGIRFRFDYKIAPGGTERPGVVFTPGPTDWLVAESSFETQGEEGLDYAVILLDRLIEPDRGYIQLPSNSPPVVPGMPLLILQHPPRGPLKLVFEPNGAIGLSSDNRFIRHRLATEPGSAGSPIFNSDLALIGLHQGHRDRKSDEKLAIAIAAIVEDLRRKNVDVLDLTGRRPLDEVQSTDEISKRLRDYRPLAEPQVPPEEPPSLVAYRKAAAVLAFFDIGKLKPLPPAEPDELAVVQLMTECSFRTDPARGPRYSLNPDVRGATLAKMKLSDVQRALRLNREFPEELPQRLFSALVLDEPLPEIGTDVRRLRDLLQAVTWLQRKVDDLPNEKLLRQRIAREELLAPHRHLAGSNFRGRAYELFRLGALVDGDGTKPLLIHGIGGSGKSALIARFLLDRHQGVGPWVPFVFLDIDRPVLVAEEPMTLLTEAVRQLGAQFPEVADEAGRCVARWEKQLDKAHSPRAVQKPPAAHHGLARYPLDETYRRKIRREFLRFLRRILLPGDRLLLALDTFEEVQYRSRDAVDQFWTFLSELRKDVPGLRVVISGARNWKTGRWISCHSATSTRRRRERWSSRAECRRTWRRKSSD